MSKPQKPIPAKFIVGLISGNESQALKVKKILENKFGPIDGEIGPINFSITSYYEKEFGNNLKRYFFSFKKPIQLDNSERLKIYTNKLEKRLQVGNVRTVNIDPGYITLAKLVLFTGKNRSHRVYLGNGIYGELELQFSDNSFQPVEFTYPDYKTDEYIQFFNDVRGKHADRVKPLIKKK